MGAAETNGHSAAEATEATRVAVAAGPLAGPVLARVVGIGASRADLPVDRLDDALLLADVIAAHAPSLVPEGRIELTSTSLTGCLELRLGPLRAGGAEKLLDETSARAWATSSCAWPALTSVVEQQGGDTLVIEISA